MSKPFFSIIMPTHNGSRRMMTAMSSIAQQTFKDYELIVICDMCDDDSEYIAKAYTDKVISVRYSRDGLSRNTGLDIAEGEWILFIDDDDHFLHEYCFEKLAEKLQECDSDVLDFSFIWRNQGYKTPSPEETFVMVWSRAWRRSFIGAHRFNDKQYGSDVDFFAEMILNNNDVKVSFWDFPMYYYNYMREGSLSWMEKKKTVLEIIVTHCNEPWILGKPFFDMLEHQYNADFSDVTVTLVQDGEEGSLNWDKLLLPYPYDVNIITLKEHSGVSAARNTALAKSSAQWVMFCNFDDMLSDVCSLAMYLDNLPTDQYDVIWSKIIHELMWFSGHTYINKIDGVSFGDVAGKMYRRAFLQEHHITFPENEEQYYDHMFNTIVLAETQPFLIATLTTDFYPYFKTFRKDSTRHTSDAFLTQMRTAAKRDFTLASYLFQRNKDFESTRAAFKAIYREYYSAYNPETNVNTHMDRDEFLHYFHNYQYVLSELSQNDKDPIIAEVEVEVMNLIQSYYNEHKQEMYLACEGIAFDDWIQSIEAVHSAEENNVIVQNPDEDPLDSDPQDNVTPEHEPHVVVYCGTYDVYMNMIASLKSLLCTTPVDKVYFLTEDDREYFPYKLPDIVEVINVKDQNFFPPDGPNYNNSWTYMCMMRAIYPELFVNYHKILSLDIDVVIDDNVSDLWDYDLSDYYLAGVPERQRQKKSTDPLYINFGVVMMNLDKLRQDRKQDEIIRLLNTQKIDCPEQGAFNRACAGHILELPSDYNYTTYSHITGDAQNERIIHYAGQKFWRHYSMVKKYADLDWNEVMNRQNKLKAGDSNG